MGYVFGGPMQGNWYPLFSATMWALNEVWNIHQAEACVLGSGHKKMVPA